MARAKNIVASTPYGDITTEMTLGFLAILLIPDRPISTAKLKRTWVAHGQDEKLVPKVRRGVDVFTAACRSIESRRDTTGDRIHEIKVDRVMGSSEECIYQVTQLVRDRDNKVIEHPKAMRLTFLASDQSIKDEALDDKKLYRELSQLADVIRYEYERNSSKVPGSKVRHAFRETLLREHAIRIQNKGVFFVPTGARGTLQALQEVLQELYGDTGEAEMLALPVASDKTEKAMVKKHYEANVSDEIDGLLTEISGRLKTDNPPRTDRRASMIAQRKKIGEGAEQYRLMLDEKGVLLGTKLELLDDALEKLLLTV